MTQQNAINSKIARLCVYPAYYSAQGRAYCPLTDGRLPPVGLVRIRRRIAGSSAAIYCCYQIVISLTPEKASPGLNGTGPVQPLRCLMTILSVAEWYLLRQNCLL